MNKIEKALTELETMVEIGCTCLATVQSYLDFAEWWMEDRLNEMDMDEIASNMGYHNLPQLVRDQYAIDDIYSEDDIIDYTINECSPDDLLYNIGEDDIIDFLSSNYGTDSLLNAVDEYDIKSYVTDTYDIEEWVETSLK